MTFVKFTTRLFLGILFVITNYCYAQTLCQPGAPPPLLNNCPNILTVLEITDPSLCTVANPITTPAVVQVCDEVSILSFPSILSINFLLGDSGGTLPGLIPHGTDSITVIGVSDGAPAPFSINSYCIFIPCAGTLSFNFRARMSNNDNFFDDQVVLRIENAITGTFVVDGLTPGGSFAQGTRTYNVDAGDRVCFEVYSDNLTGADSLTISSFKLVGSGLPTISVVGPRPGDELSCGTYFGAFYATNCMNLSSLCEFEIQVVDSTKPIIAHCPIDINIQLEGENCDILVSWNIPNAMDPCPYNPGFISQFAPYTWTNNNIIVSQVQDAGQDAIINHDASLLSITGASNGLPDFSQPTAVEHLIPCNGTISFDWEAQVEGGTFMDDDAGYYTTSGGGVTLSLPLDENYANGSVTIPVIAGDQISFIVNSDNRDFENTLRISNFTFTPDPVSVTQTAGPTPFSVLTPGTYTVEYTANNCCGITTCSFDINILPNPAISCKNVNVSLDQNCEVTITPEMLLTGGVCPDYKIIELSHYNHPIPNPVDSHFLDKTMPVVEEALPMMAALWWDLGEQAATLPRRRHD